MTQLILALALAVAAPTPTPTLAPTPAPLTAGERAPTVVRLIEDHAAPHWELTIDQAWAAYDDGELAIEDRGDGWYELRYADGILEVLLTEE